MFLVLMRAYPMIINLVLIFAYILSYEKFYLKIFYILTMSSIFNFVLKTKVFEPIMRNKNFPLFGTGKRPIGNNNCGLGIFNHNLRRGYGMPSGHTQYAGVLSAILSRKLYYSKYNNFIKVFGILGLFLLVISVAYSRILLKCHTIQQTVVGGLIGIFIGYKSYKYT